MIVRRGLDFGRLITFMGPLLLALLAYDVAVTVLYMSFGYKALAINDLPLPLLGSALVLVVTLRNNAAYARWWEARGLWGSVVNNSRSLARGVQMVTRDPALHRMIAEHQVAYALALRCHLLKKEPWDDIAKYLPAGLVAELRGVVNVPAGIQMAMAQALGRYTSKQPGGSQMGLVALDRTLCALADAQGGLERIKNTPLPRQYMQFPMVFIRVYCLLLPLGLVGDMGWFTPIGSTVIGFMFLSLDRIGGDLEDPFEGTVHDIPMQAITRTIEIDLLQVIGAEEVPDPVGKVDGVVW